jgi:CheY-like chemotaxis protein
MDPCRTVLIVEDDEDIRATMRLALELKGYTIVEAGNGREGIDALVTMPRPCLILLDLMMPVMDGWAFLTALERDSTLDEIPVVVVTAIGQPEGTIKARSIIAKPLPLEVLYATVREYCGEGAVPKA